MYYLGHFHNRQTPPLGTAVWQVRARANQGTKQSKPSSDKGLWNTEQGCGEEG